VVCVRVQCGVCGVRGVRCAVWRAVAGRKRAAVRQKSAGSAQRAEVLPRFCHDGEYRHRHVATRLRAATGYRSAIRDSIVCETATRRAGHAGDGEEKATAAIPREAAGERAEGAASYSDGSVTTAICRAERQRCDVTRYCCLPLKELPSVPQAAAACGAERAPRHAPPARRAEYEGRATARSAYARRRVRQPPLPYACFTATVPSTAGKQAERRGRSESPKEKYQQTQQYMP